MQHMDKVRHLRLVHEAARARYVALLDMDSQDSADTLYREFNGKPYSSMDTERCVVLFVKDVLFLDDLQSSSAAAKVGNPMQAARCRQGRGWGGVFKGTHLQLSSVCARKFKCVCEQAVRERVPL
jgi:hypothetical protein